MRLSLLLLLAPAACLASPPEARATFHSIGLYWSPKDGSEKNTCSVQYRAKGEEGWREGLPLWYDARTVTGRPPEYRGSLVHLKPGTDYEVKLSLKSGGEAALSAATWSEDFPVGETVSLPKRSTQTLLISQGGGPGAYRLYKPAGKQAVIDLKGKADVCVEVKASYVILRGLTLKNAAMHGIRMGPGVHHVVVEDCDISGWGRVAPDGWGMDYDSAVYSDSKDNHHFVVQRNRLHDPRSNSNSWAEARPHYGGNKHPAGPQGVTFFADLQKSIDMWRRQAEAGWDAQGKTLLTRSAKPDPMSEGQGQHVIRYNEIWGSKDHYFNDGIGGGENCSFDGFPGRDSDVYGNKVSHCWDNPLETEGGCMNVRVWDNFLEDSYSAVAIAPVSVGPAYVWRNVANRSRWGRHGSTDEDKRGRMLKSKPCDDYDLGRIYFFHNSTLQEAPPPGSSLPLGVSGGVEGSANFVSRNNILQVHKSDGLSIKDINPRGGGPYASSYDYDLFNGLTRSAGPQEAHGVFGVPAYGPDGRSLAPGSPGLDAGVRLPNFNDDYQGAAPDMGAREASLP